MGDAALPCFQLAKIFKQAPQKIADDLAQQLSAGKDDDSVIAKVEAAGPYVNFFINPAAVAAGIITAIHEQ